MITTIIFDAFGTLFKVAEGGSAKKIIYNIVACDKEVDYESFVKEWKNFYKRYTVSESLFRIERDIFISRIKMFYDRFGVNRSTVEDTDALLAEAFERKAYEEAKEVLDKLREKYNVFIGSNTDNDVLESVMIKNGISVDKIYTSENLKCYKPNMLFFKKILEDNGLEPEEVLFVGDSVSDDILGPKALGINTVLVNRSEKTGDFGQDYTINDLRMLYEILGEDKKELLFYDEYEEFYAMAKTSDAFSRFCKDAFGEDFSQDGFSDIKQIDELLEHIPQRDNMHILDIGCGNGKNAWLYAEENKCVCLWF